MTADHGKPVMISMEIGGTLVTARATAVCVHDERILICREQDLPYWYLPGGRIHAGESSVEALQRELVEEIGTRPERSELIWVAENFFVLEGKRVQEIGLYFAVDLPANAEALAWLGTTTRIEDGDGMTMEWTWFPLTDLPSIDLRPAFLAARLSIPGSGLSHIIHRDG